MWILNNCKRIIVSFPVQNCKKINLNLNKKHVVNRSFDHGAKILVSDTIIRQKYCLPIFNSVIIAKGISTSFIACKKAKKARILKNVSKYNVENEPLDESEVFEDEEYNNLLSQEASNLLGHSSIAIIQPWIKWGKKKKRYTTAEMLLDEACALVNSLPAMDIKFKEIIGLQSFGSSYLFGTGNVARLSSNIQIAGAQAVFISIDHLSIGQRSDLEEIFKVRVYDRFSIVLSIFKFYAQTSEAKLQIAMAELPTMTKSYTTETEKMIIHRYEAKLKKALTKLALQRSKIRENRKKHAYPSVAIIGYTNCGKTTLISLLSGDENIVGENRLFATLDVTVHMGRMPCGLNTLYVDSVGFIQDIPISLIASFQATLQDALNADVIVHMRDISHPDIVAQNKSVLETLEEINVPSSTPIIVVNNKTDRLEETFETFPHLDKEHDVYKDGFYISAKTGEGISAMLTKIQEELLEVTGRKTYSMKLPIGSKNISWIQSNLTVTNEEVMEDSQHMRLLVLMNDAEKALYIRTFNI